MFSSFTSFLPSGLQQFGSDNRTPVESSAEEHKERDHDQSTGATDKTDNSAVDEAGVKKKPKKDRTNETFIVVRPPPAKSNHPLNLQVQLVPPSTKGATERSLTNRQSLSDFSAPVAAVPPADPNALTRVPSNRSDTTSLYSGYSSVASFSSVASTTSSTRRMIIPLYNLQAHNVMTNLVVDAGTDAKVAKFMKRGIELIGLAVLEPVEVWPSAGSAFSNRGLLQPGVGRGASSSRPVTPDQQQIGTPTSSALSLSSAGNDVIPVSQQFHPSMAVTTIPEMPMQPTGAKKIFGKLFKRKDGSTGGNSSSLGHTRTSSLTNTIDLSRRHLSPPPRTSTSKRLSGSDNASIGENNTERVPTAEQNILRPPVLGIQPTLSSPVYPPVGRPTKYVWVVRRWLKGTDAGGLLGAMGRLSSGVGTSGKEKDIGTGIAAGMVEVRFEWSRGKSGRKKERGRGRKGSIKRNASGSRRTSAIVSNADTANESAGNGNSPQQSPSKRHSVLSHHTASSANDTSDEQHAPAEDDGEDSDPEDSETPWNCTLRLARVSPPLTARLTTSSSFARPGTSSGRPTTSSSTARPSSSQGVQPTPSDLPPQPVKLKIAALSPTPHHPKVVALLKVPFPLPDIEVEKMAVVKRVMTPQGLMKGTEGAGGLVLTAEEMKDIVSTTALWLVVREGFGGVGKVSRKGDGWRIRA